MSALASGELSPLASWPSMSLERYAAFEQATGINVVRLGEIFWQQPRPFFYRPLLPFKKYSLPEIREQFNRAGVFQIAVGEGQTFNSYLNPIVYEKPHEYDARKLRDSARKNLNKALKNPVVVRSITNEEEFSAVGYPTYLSFYRRTKYKFDIHRREKDKFERWAHEVFQFREAIVLGIFLKRELISFEIACVVEDALILKSLVSSDAGLQLNAPDLLLHYYRTIAQQHPKISLIYDGMLSAKSSLNNYKVRRGARIEALPAFLYSRPDLLWLIKKINRDQYERLRGFSNQQIAAKGLVKYLEHANGPEA